MQKNPFTSIIFTSIWSKHFNHKKKVQTLKCIPQLRFTKTSGFSYWINVGGTLTKGIYYKLLDTPNFDYKNKVFLIYDVPDYFGINNTVTNNNLGYYAIKQYPGFLVNLSEFTDLTHYMNSTFSKSSRYKLNKYKKRFEHCFDIQYHMFYGEISKNEYDNIFNCFKKLLKKRFDDKKVANNNLRPEEWNFYYEVAYPMILQKKASLFVIYDSGIPIGITLNYFSEHIVFDAITVFDIDYSKFHLGSITIMKLIEWSLENKFKIFDFSKGYFDYKTRWSTKAYNFEYHIYYDSSSLKAKSTAWLLRSFFRLKNYLRDKKLNEKLDKLTYLIKNKNPKNKANCNYSFVEMDYTLDLKNIEPINTDKLNSTLLKSIACEFLYLNNECMKNLKVYKLKDQQITYLLLGSSKQIGVSITKNV